MAQTDASRALPLPPPQHLPPAGSYATGQPQPPASTEAVLAMVFAALGWLCFPLGFVAIPLGAHARRLARENPAVGGDQLALAAMIIGGALAGLQLVFWLFYLIFFAGMFAWGWAKGGGP